MAAVRIVQELGADREAGVQSLRQGPWVRSRHFALVATSIPMVWDTPASMLSTSRMFDLARAERDRKMQ